MSTLHDQLTQIQRTGAGGFAATKLGNDHASVTRTVRRHRTARAAATTVTGVGVVGAAAWGAMASFAFNDELTPQAPAPSAASVSPSPSPSPSTTRVENTLALPAGKTLDFIAATLAGAYGASQEDASVALASAVQEFIPEASTAEGWPMPGTFDLAGFATMSDAADMLVAARVTELTALGVPRDDWQTTLTKASLVEREAALDENRPKIARVIDNRLAQDMRLELDSTVKYYATSEGVFTTAEERAVDSPYNTYVYRGLPPGAIATPSTESIRAVLSPAAGDWLFFVTVNLETGEALFAANYEEHLDNVAVLQEWAAAHETTG